MPLSLENDGILLPLPKPVLVKLVSNGENDEGCVYLDDPTKVVGQGMQPKEMDVVELFLEGKNYTDIAKEAHITVPTVKAILKRPHCQEIINKEKDDFVFGLENLRRKSHKVLSDCMDENNKASDKLSAVRLLYQRTGELNQGPAETTEEHAQSIFIQIQNQMNQKNDQKD